MSLEHNLATVRKLTAARLRSPESTRPEDNSMLTRAIFDLYIAYVGANRSELRAIWKLCTSTLDASRSLPAPGNGNQEAPPNPNVYSYTQPSAVLDDPPLSVNENPAVANYTFRPSAYRTSSAPNTQLPDSLQGRAPSPAYSTTASNPNHSRTFSDSNVSARSSNAQSQWRRSLVSGLQRTVGGADVAMDAVSSVTIGAYNKVKETVASKPTNRYPAPQSSPHPGFANNHSRLQPSTSGLAASPQLASQPAPAPGMYGPGPSDDSTTPSFTHPSVGNSLTYATQQYAREDPTYQRSQNYMASEPSSVDELLIESLRLNVGATPTSNAATSPPTNTGPAEGARSATHFPERPHLDASPGEVRDVTLTALPYTESPTEAYTPTRFEPNTRRPIPSPPNIAAPSLNMPQHPQYQASPPASYNSRSPPPFTSTPAPSPSSVPALPPRLLQSISNARSQSPSTTATTARQNPPFIASHPNPAPAPPPRRTQQAGSSGPQAVSEEEMRRATTARIAMQEYGRRNALSLIDDYQYVNYYQPHTSTGYPNAPNSFSAQSLSPEEQAVQERLRANAARFAIEDQGRMNAISLIDGTRWVPVERPSRPLTNAELGAMNALDLI